MTMVIGPDDLIYIAQGLGEASDGHTGTLSDFWTLDPETLVFTLFAGFITSAVSGTCSTKGDFSTSLLPPSGRGRYIFSDGDGAVYFGGGSGRDFSLSWGWLSTVWKYKISTGEFGWVEGESLRHDTSTTAALMPSHLSTVTSDVQSNRIYIIPGEKDWNDGNRDYQGDVWVFDTMNDSFIGYSGPGLSNQSANFI